MIAGDLRSRLSVDCGDIDRLVLVVEVCMTRPVIAAILEGLKRHQCLTDKGISRKSKGHINAAVRLRGLELGCRCDLVAVVIQGRLAGGLVHQLTGHYISLAGI